MSPRLPTTFPSRGLSRQLRVRILCFLLLGWPAHTIAADCRVHLSMVYNYANNLLRYGSIRAPRLCKLGQPQKLTASDEEAVFELLLTEGWRRQDEIVFWLWCERGVFVNQSTISRMLKRQK